MPPKAVAGPLKGHTPALLEDAFGSPYKIPKEQPRQKSGAMKITPILIPIEITTHMLPGAPGSAGDGPPKVHPLPLPDLSIQLVDKTRIGAVAKYLGQSNNPNPPFVTNLAQSGSLTGAKLYQCSVVDALMVMFG